MWAAKRRRGARARVFAPRGCRGRADGEGRREPRCAVHLRGAAGCRLVFRCYDVGVRSLKHGGNVKPPSFSPGRQQAAPVRCEHGRQHPERRRGARAGAAAAPARFSLGWVVALNLGLAGAQILVGTSILSLALVSDGFHNLSDAAAAVVAQLAEAFDRRDFDARTLPFGYARRPSAPSSTSPRSRPSACPSR